MNVAVLIPCYNEEASIASVVESFRAALPQAAVYVYDNNSTDDTARVAAQAGAIVRNEPNQGKGSVIRRMFAEIDADLYLLVDGDSTYDASIAPRMIEMAIDHRLAMLVGRRVEGSSTAYPSGHRFGNKMFTRAVAMLFGAHLHDILSGYRVFSRGFVKSFPGFSRGFEIETELTVHALTLRLPVGEIETVYKERPTGSSSKLNKYSDGTRILWTIFTLFKNEQPFVFFSILSAAIPNRSVSVGVSNRHHVLRNRPGSTLPDRDSRHRPDYFRHDPVRLRIDSRHRHKRSARDEAAALLE